MNAQQIRNTRQKFYQHLTAYVAVNLFLFITDVVDGGEWSFYNTLLTWGIFLGFHALQTFGSSNNSDAH